MNQSEELPNDGLTVSFLEYMKDVTEEVMLGTENLSDEDKQKSDEERDANYESQYII